MKASELAKHLNAYISQPENADVEVMIQFDGDVAFPILRGDNHDAMGASLERFLVLIPDFHGARLRLGNRH